MAKQSLLPFPDTKDFLAPPFNRRPPQAQRHLPATRRSLACYTPDRDAVDKSLKALNAGKSQAVQVAATILASRGMESHPELATFLSPSVQNLPLPSRFRNFDKAADTVIAAIRNGEKIGIVGDYDVDGVTSVSQLVKTLQILNHPHDYWIPNRFVDGYGTSSRIVDEILSKECSLVVMFDHGTKAHAQIEALRARGINVVVFDHHPTGDTLPNAVVVNPRQEGCGLSHESPSASVLSYFLDRRIRQVFSLSNPDVSLAALGAVADVVPLKGMNRDVVRTGLSDIRRNSNIGITALANALKVITEQVVASDLGFLLAPAINASGRLNDASRCVELLTTSDPRRAAEIASELVELNRSRKERQSVTVLENMEHLGESKSLSPAIISFSPSHHPGINVLVASSLASRYTRPTFVFSRNEDGTLTASARSGNPHFDLTKILTEASAHDREGAIIQWGGHPAAAGAKIIEEKLPFFRSLIDAAMEKHYPEPLHELTVVADTILRLKDITPGFVSRVNALLEPHGAGFEAPQYLFEEVRITHIEQQTGGRYMLELEQGGTLMRAFVGPELWNSDLYIGAMVSVVATPANVYRGRDQHVQLRINGYCLVIPPGAEVCESHEGSNPLPEAGVTVSADEKAKSTSEVSLFDTLRRQLQDVITDFDDRFIYPELARRQPDYFNTATKETLHSWWRELTEEYDLRLNSDTIEYRPAAVEFVRYFFDRGGNHILQAPTGSGKTEIALMIASHFRKRDQRVIFLAPTIDIVRQQSERVKKLLGEEAVILDGSATSPEEREKIYSTNPGFIVATPHVISNDLTSGVFQFSPNDLLIVDEAHNASGDYPFVPTVRAARAQNSRVLALSATPAQVLPGESWEKLDALKDLVGTDVLFPLNVRNHRPELSLRKVPLSPEIDKAVGYLASRMDELQQRVLSELQYLRCADSLSEASKLFGEKTILFPSSYAMTALRARVRALTGSGKWEAYSLLTAIGELSELHHCLIQQGKTAFLLRCIEKRYEVTFPPRARAGQRTLAPSRAMLTVYSNRSIHLAFNVLGNATTRRLWLRNDLEATMRCHSHQWSRLKSSDRVTLFNRTVRQSKAQAQESLRTDADFWDHPKEKFVIESIARHGKRTFISVRDRDHAIFLAQRINALLGARGVKAVALTGKGQGARKGISHIERVANLRAFNDGTASVIVGTSASNEGVDIDAEHGYIMVFDGSQTRAKQKEGRVGRRQLGKVDYLCTTGLDHGKVLQILRKDAAFQEMLNRERAKITGQAGLPPLAPVRTREQRQERALPLFDQPEF